MFSALFYTSFYETDLIGPSWIIDDATLVSTEVLIRRQSIYCKRKRERGLLVPRGELAGRPAGHQFIPSGCGQQRETRIDPLDSLLPKTHFLIRKSTCVPNSCPVEELLPKLYYFVNNRDASTSKE